MNTPKPCDECINCYYNALYEDDPSYESECMVKSEYWGNIDYPYFILALPKFIQEEP
jgi:hypothetical protein